MAPHERISSLVACRGAGHGIALRGALRLGRGDRRERRSGLGSVRVSASNHRETDGGPGIWGTANWYPQKTSSEIGPVCICVASSPTLTRTGSPSTGASAATTPSLTISPISSNFVPGRAPCSSGQDPRLQEGGSIFVTVSGSSSVGSRSKTRGRRTSAYDSAIG